MDSILSAGQTFELPRGEAHHIRRVLRGRSGDAFEAVDPDGRLLLAELREDGGLAMALEALQATKDDATVTLYQAVPKGRHMDLVVEKTTELGVTRIVPVVSEHGVVRLSDGKVDRWRRIAEAAARQSLRLSVPEIPYSVKFEEAVRESGDEGIMLHNGPGLARLEECVHGRTVSLFVGPEGGWSEDELRMAEEAGMPATVMGPYRLRSETAGIVAVARARAVLETSSGGEETRT